MGAFKAVTPFEPRGDQPEAIERLSQGVLNGDRLQVLKGVTGSGKTFTMAKVIERVQKPTLVIAHNKTLAAQLCGEFKEFFPDSAVEYFVSYYDYYQPEAYIASSDTYIEKVATVNDEIDKLRLSATSALNERRDVIIVASVSCIYALGDPEEYLKLSVSVREGMRMERDELLKRLVDIQYQRSEFDFNRGNFRVKGDTVDVMPANWSDKALRISFFGDEIERISEINALTGQTITDRSHAAIFPATHYVTGRDKLEASIGDIEADMQKRVAEFNAENKLLEAQRIAQRTEYDIEMMREIGYCQGIENYSRYFDGRKPGQPPFTLLDYFPDDFLMFIDESHVTLPQIRGMYAGDYSRKKELVEYGFRLPAAFDNRPLRYEEFEKRINQLICVSATPGEYETDNASQIVEQIIRPTGLIDPEIVVRPAKNQVDDLLGEIRAEVEHGRRVLVTTLTKRMAESLTDYLKNLGIRVRYLHSDIQTMERTQLIRDLRLGEFDVLVGINLLREGLDMPEVSLVAILDADKEGFLRSETSLIQTIGRAARNVDGRVILYGDVLTESMERAMNETNRRRALQEAYNKLHGITPQSVKSTVQALIRITDSMKDHKPDDMSDEELQELMKSVEDQMLSAAKDLDFERAAKLRDELFRLKGEKHDDIQKPQVRRHRRPRRTR